MCTRITAYNGRGFSADLKFQEVCGQHKKVHRETPSDSEFLINFMGPKAENKDETQLLLNFQLVSAVRNIQTPALTV
jgi:hypothetical protein